MQIMKNEKENKLNEVWKTPEITVLNVNENTENGVTTPSSDASTAYS
jgi:hypothetical protein